MIAAELAHDINSNFFSIAHPRPPNRFVDEGMNFISTVPEQPD